MARTALQLSAAQVTWVTAGVNGDLILLETTTPSTISGSGQIYVKSSDHLLYYQDTNGVESVIETSTSGANTALSNLASVAINAVLIPASAAGLDFGSTAKPWKDIWLAGSSGTPGTNQFKITGASTSGVRTITLPDASTTIPVATQVLTFAGPTSARTITFPDASITVARTDAANTFTGNQTFSAIVLGANGQISMANTASAGDATGPTTSSFNSGYSSSAIGDLVYLDSSDTWQKADATTSAATKGGFLGVALSVAASGAALKVALPGSFIFAAAWNLATVGAPIYMSTAGSITLTPPSSTDNAIRVIGWVVASGSGSTKIWFQPSPDYITHT